MSSLLVKNALAIVTVDDEDRILKNENILIEDGVITYIGKEARQADREIPADGCFVYPGLINTHNHLYQTFTRNLPQVQKMELFPWLITLYEIWKGLDDIGQLSIGKAGDLFLVDAAGLDTVGVSQDPGSFLGTVGCSKPAKSVVVAGREVVRDGRLLGIDEEETARKAQVCAGRLNRA